MLATLDKFHKTRIGYVVFGLVELVMAYGFLDWAFDSGNLLWWACAIALTVGGLHNLFTAVFPDKKDKK